MLSLCVGCPVAPFYHRYICIGEPLQRWILRNETNENDKKLDLVLKLSSKLCVEIKRQHLEMLCERIDRDWRKAKTVARETDRVRQFGRKEVVLNTSCGGMQIQFVKQEN